MSPVRTAGVMMLFSLVIAFPARAHCDALDGPVVNDARAALAGGDVGAVLKWVGEKDEPEIRAAFQRTQAVRGLGQEARELADLYFFETVVRVHRATEGAPYTGLKPAGTPVSPAVRAADASLAGGSVDRLVEHITQGVEKGIRERFRLAAETRKHASHSTEAGRKFVREYVEFVHYVERLHRAATTPAAHAPASASEHDTHGHEESH